MSKQVSLSKISSILQKMKIDQNSIYALFARRPSILDPQVWDSHIMWRVGRYRNCIKYSRVSLRVGLGAYWLVVGMIIVPVWFDQLEECFCLKEFQFKRFCPALKTSSALLLEMLNKTLNTERRSQIFIMLQKRLKFDGWSFEKCLQFFQQDYKLDRTLVRACSGMVTKFCEVITSYSIKFGCINSVCKIFGIPHCSEVFVEGAKWENPEKNPGIKARTNDIVNPHKVPGPELNLSHCDW